MPDSHLALYISECQSTEAQQKHQNDDDATIHRREPFVIANNWEAKKEVEVQQWNVERREHCAREMPSARQ